MKDRAVACLGDSNTYGYDPRSYFGGRYPKDVRWTGRLKKSGWTVFNYGTNGLAVSNETAHSVLVQDLLISAPLGAAVIMLGSNDLLMGLSAGQATASMEKLVTRILAEKAAETLILVAPPVFARGLWVSSEAQIRESRQLAKEYRRLAAEKDILFADAGSWEIPLFMDGVHFTEEGHRVFAEKLGDVLETAISRGEALPDV